MLQRIHEKVKGWVAGVLLTFISITFALWGISNYFNHGSGKVVVAKVNGVPVTDNQLEVAFKQYVDQDPSLLQEKEGEKKLKQSLLDSLLLKEALIQNALKMNYYISPAQVQAFIFQLPFLQMNGQFSKERFFLMLNQLHLSETEYLKELRNDLLLQQLQSSFYNTAFSLPHEVSQMTQILHQQREITYATLTPSMVHQKPNVSEEDIQKYYQAHSKEFTIPEQVQFAYIQLFLGDLKNKIQISDEELKRYYEENQSTFFVNQHQQTFEEVKENIRKMLIAQKAEQQFSNLSEQLANLSYEDPASLQGVSDTLHLPILTSPLVENKKGQPGIANNPAVLKETFSDDVYTQGYNSKIISLNDGEQVVLRILKKVPPHLKPLSEVRAEIISSLSQAFLQQQLKGLATQMVKEISGGSSIDQVSKKYSLQWKTNQLIQRTSLLPTPLILEAFNISGAEKLPQVKEVMLPEGNEMIFILQKIIPGNTTNLTEMQKKAIGEKISESNGKNAFDVYSKAVYGKARIKMTKP